MYCSVLLTLVMCLMLAAACCAVGPVPPEIADCKIAAIWQFNTDGDAEGWVADHNVSPLVVKGGLCTFELTGSDPWILRPNLDIDTAGYGFVGVKMRSDREGSNQIYFATSEKGFGENGVITYHVQGDEKFHFYESEMSALKTWTGRLSSLRLDPVNGANEKGAKVDVDWIAVYQVPARLKLGRLVCFLENDKPAVALSVENIGGETMRDAAEIELLDGAGQAADVISARTISGLMPREQIVWKETFEPGPSVVSVRVRYGGKVIYQGAAHTVRRMPSEMSMGVGIIENDRVRLAAVAGRPGAAKMQFKSGLRWITAGVLASLADVAVQGTDGAVYRSECTMSSAQAVDADKGLWTASGGPAAEIPGKLRVNWLVSLPAGSDASEWTITLTAGEDVKLLRFAGPRYLVGDDTSGRRKDGGLFPGLEYLEKDEPGSAEKHIGPKFADRRVPHPHKVTVPVMAIEQDGFLTGMMWKPLEEWSAGKALPCAHFESPNREPGAGNHLMEIFVPTIPNYVRENDDIAATPYELKAGEKITLRCWVFAKPEARITDAVPLYYRMFGTPASPPVVHGTKGTIDTCLKAWTDSLYSADKKGWKNHIGLHQDYGFDNQFAAIITAEARRQKKPDLLRKVGLPANAKIEDYVGTSEGWISDARQKVIYSTIDQQSPDGGFAYAIDEEMKKKIADFQTISGSDQTTLGDVGETNSGLTARSLLGVVDYACQTGDPKAVDSALRGVAKINSFTVPRGSQTWEVHAHTPDVVASAQALACNLRAYHLTGDPKYVEWAKFWAYTGLPFAYAWKLPLPPPAGVLVADENGEGKNMSIAPPTEFYRDPNRIATPYSTIPVFGTSFFVVSWFGNAVQWCGLAWAVDTQKLCQEFPDPLLRAVADGVFAVGTQWQTDKGFLAGTYPDTWHMVGNQITQAFITPNHIYQYAAALDGWKWPGQVESRMLRAGQSKIYFSTNALLGKVALEAAKLAADLSYLPGEPFACMVVGADRPKSVLVAGKQAIEAEDLKSKPNTWKYDEAKKALHVRVTPKAAAIPLQISW